MKKTIIFILIALIAFSTYACQNKTDTSGAVASGIQSAAGSTAKNKADNLPDNLNFNGAAIKILNRKNSGGESWDGELYAENLNGELVNDAVYTRNSEIKERLNLNVEYIQLDGTWDGRDAFLNAVTKSVLAGDDAYDLIAGYQYYLPSLLNYNCLSDLSKFPYIDYSQPWWPDNILSEMAVKGKLYFITGNAALSTVKAMFVTFFNKKLAVNYGLDMYSIVDSGDWTIDKAGELCRLASKDINGDGTLDEKTDQYGYLGQTPCQFFDQFDLKLTKIDSEGVPEYNFDAQNDKISSIVDKVYSFYNDNVGVISHAVRNKYTPAEMTGMFKESRILFYMQATCYASLMRDMNDDFGIIPLFKWDTEQDKYCTLLRDDYSLFCVPVTSVNKDAAGAYLEAAAASNYETVIPDYFITTLGNKVTRDSQSYKMLNMISQNILYSFAQTYSSLLSNVKNMMNDLVLPNSSKYSSYYASNISKWQSSLDSLIKLTDDSAK